MPSIYRNKVKPSSVNEKGKKYWKCNEMNKVRLFYMRSSMYVSAIIVHWQVASTSIPKPIESATV